MPASPEHQALGRLPPKGVGVKHPSSISSLGPSVCAHARLQGAGARAVATPCASELSPWQGHKAGQRDQRAEMKRELAEGKSS